MYTGTPEFFIAALGFVALTTHLALTLGLYIAQKLTGQPPTASDPPPITRTADPITHSPVPPSAE